MVKHERTCAVCRKKTEKQSFIRIVKQKNGSVFIDKSFKADGRGVYICLNKECLDKAIKTKALNRAFKMEVNNQVYEELRNLL